MDDLKNKKCVPCKGGIDPLNQEKIEYYMKATPTWSVIEDNKKIEKDFKFKDFKGAINFINKVADLAENEGHHPDIYLHGWNKVKFILWTHAIKGLFENDFIMAVKIDLLAEHED